MIKQIVKKPSISDTLAQLSRSGDMVVFKAKDFNLNSVRSFAYKWASSNDLSMRVQVSNDSVTVTLL